MIHQILSMAYLSYLLRLQVFESRQSQQIEVFCEAMGMLLSTVSMQFMRQDNGKEAGDLITISFLSVAGLLVLLSTLFMLRIGCASHCRAYRMKKSKESWLKKKADLDEKKQMCKETLKFEQDENKKDFKAEMRTYGDQKATVNFENTQPIP